MEFNEIWGISLERIQEFFTLQADVEKTGDGFCYAQARITLTPLPSSTATGLPMPRTRVEISGSDTDAEKIHHRFFMRFLSAGG